MDKPTIIKHLNGDEVAHSVLKTPYYGYTHRCEGLDKFGNYATKLGKSHDDAYNRWSNEIALMRIHNEEARRFRNEKTRRR